MGTYGVIDEVGIARAHQVRGDSGEPVVRESRRVDGGAGWAGDAGMATAEYAIATLAACGFAGLLVAILSSDEVRSMLLGIVRRALALG